MHRSTRPHILLVMMNYFANSAPVSAVQLVNSVSQLPPFDLRWALFLDFDGTLADIAPLPDKAVLQPEVKASVIARREMLSGALALVSGRTIADLDVFFSPCHLAAAGMHGAEMRLPDGERVALSNGNYNVFSVVAARLRAAVVAIRMRVATLALPICGTATTFGSANNG